MKTIAIVGCGKTKLARRARAKNLYIGSLFRAARLFAETCDAWRIASARFGIAIDPERVIEPYEMRLDPKHAQQWGQSIANGIVCDFLEGEPYELLILAGEDYAAPIERAMRLDAGVEGIYRCNCAGVRRPLVGLGLGERLAWFKASRVAS